MKLLKNVDNYDFDVILIDDCRGVKRDVGVDIYVEIVIEQFCDC